MVQIIDKKSGSCGLLKAHSEAITDLQFFSDDNDLLASVGRDGNVFIWRLFQQDNNVMYPFHFVLI